MKFNKIQKDLNSENKKELKKSKLNIFINENDLLVRNKKKQEGYQDLIK